MVVGFARAADQHPELRRAGSERIHTDRVSGQIGRHPQVEVALAALSAEDVLAVWALDRLNPLPSDPPRRRTRRARSRAAVAVGGHRTDDRGRPLRLPVPEGRWPSSSWQGTLSVEWPTMFAGPENVRLGRTLPRVRGLNPIAVARRQRFQVGALNRWVLRRRCRRVARPLRGPGRAPEDRMTVEELRVLRGAGASACVEGQAEGAGPDPAAVLLRPRDRGRHDAQPSRNPGQIGPRPVPTSTCPRCQATSKRHFAP